MPTAMIVDDNATLAFFTARNLEKGIHGLEVIMAASCEEARAAAKKYVPSVLIADIELTDGNGVDLVGEMRGRYPHMLAILISGDPPVQAVTDELFGFLLKPYEAEELVDLVQKALAGATSSERQSVLPEPEPEPEPEHCNGYDRHKLRNHLGELVAGLRAFGQELRDCSADSEAVRRTVDEYLDQLCSTAMKVSTDLPKCPATRTHRALKD
ncbi:MAG: response regulator [Desulfomonilaceae bacterium]|nr:response regulator [Desulfomonilaceae bacterium]